MNLVDHARRELALIDEDPDYAASIIAAVEAFAAYDGHSGGSVGLAIHQLTALLSYENLSPLTADPAEWFDHGEVSGTPLWQNVRNSAAFSEDGGRTYYLVSEKKHRQIYTSAPAARDAEAGR